MLTQREVGLPCIYSPKGFALSAGCFSPGKSCPSTVSSRRCGLSMAGGFGQEPATIQQWSPNKRLSARRALLSQPGASAPGNPAPAPPVHGGAVSARWRVRSHLTPDQASCIMEHQQRWRSFAHQPPLTRQSRHAATSGNPRTV